MPIELFLSSPKLRRIRRIAVIIATLCWGVLAVLGFLYFRDMYIGFGSLLLAAISLASLRLDTRRKGADHA